MKIFIKKYWWHLFFWAGFIIYEVTSVRVFTGAFSNSRNYLMHYPINIGLVYLLSEFVLPGTIGKKPRNIIMLVILVATTMFLFLILSNVADRILGRISDEVFFGNAGITKIFISNTIYRGIYFMGFGITLFLYQTGYLFWSMPGSWKKKLQKKTLNIHGWRLTWLMLKMLI